MKTDLFQESSNHHILMLCLSMIVFSAIFITGNDSFPNLLAIQRLELIFLLLYIAALREIPPIYSICKSYPIITTVIILWVISISFSFFTSPFSLVEKSDAIARFTQSMTHMVTFLFVWDFFRRYQPDLSLLYFLVPLSSILIMCTFIGEWLTLPDSVKEHLLSGNWLNDPPFNTNIRHTGFQITAALSILLVRYVNAPKLNAIEIINAIMMIALWTFLFWLGGRGAILSIFGTVFLLWLMLYIKKSNYGFFLKMTFCSALLGIFLAELLSVYEWNGLFNSVVESVSSSDLNQLSSSRLALWLTTWESVKEDLVFGLGSQAYFFMPNRILGVHPHSVFMQFLVEWGIVGSLLFFTLLIKGFLYGIKLHLFNNQQPCTHSLMAAAIITSLSIHAIVDGTYYHPQPSLYLVIAFAIWIIPKKAPPLIRT